jgi:protein gp37
VADKTGIEWTDATWNPTTGCDKVSPGCDHCYAMTLAPRLKAMGSPKYQTDGNPATSGPGFGYAEHPTALDQPLRWTRARRIFVNSMSDLFHQDATPEFQARVWAVMALSGQHTFQVLTKRPGVMRSRLSADWFRRSVAHYAYRIVTGQDPEVSVSHNRQAAVPWLLDDWPLRNVWVGTSVEDQKRADLRIPHLLDTPARVRFLSCEPLLGPVSIMDALGNDLWGWQRLNQALHWVIAGGESGPGARPMDLDWARGLRDQCGDAGVAFHYKQQGSGDGGAKSRRVLDGRTWDEFPETTGG